MTWKQLLQNAVSHEEDQKKKKKMKMQKILEEETVVWSGNDSGK